MGQLHGRLALINGTEHKLGAAVARTLQASLNPPKKRPTAGGFFLAEREGFEPPLGCPKPDFESGAFDHSAISPEGRIIAYMPCSAQTSNMRAQLKARSRIFSRAPPSSIFDAG